MNRSLEHTSSTASGRVDYTLDAAVAPAPPRARDWRLEAELHGDLGPDMSLVGTVASRLEKERSASALISHHQHRLFVYARSEAALKRVRRALERLLAGEGCRATVTLSRWDRASTRWRQVDPPAPAPLRAAEEAIERKDALIETRTVTAAAGRLIDDEFEQSMLDWASKLGLRYELAVRRRIFTSQLTFTLTGAARDIRMFRRALIEECRYTNRRARQSMGVPPGPAF